MRTAAFLVCLAGGVAVAQDKSADTTDVLREKVRANKKRLVAVALDLSDGEAKAFWPVYNAYQSDMIGHYDRLFVGVPNDDRRDGDAAPQGVPGAGDRARGAVERVCAALAARAATPPGRAVLPDREQAPRARELRICARDPVAQVTC